MQGQEDISFQGKIDFRLWKRVFHIAKPYARHLIGIMICMSLCAVADVIFPRLTGYAIDNLIAKQTTDGLSWIITVFLICLLVEAGCTFIFLYLASVTEYGVCY